VHGGVKVYRGAASAARAYVEADRSRADDYYLAEGSGLARRFGAAAGCGVVDLGVLDGDGYETWVAGRDPDTGESRGRLRHDDQAVRFVEITVNGPKTWSLAAALNPEVAAAYDTAQDRAAEQIIGWVAEHATTRVGPRGRQVQVPVERIEAVTVRHYTSRAGDPHRHLHLQVNARVFAEGKWRGLHTVGFRDSIEALNGIGHAAVATDPEFRTTLEAAGFTLDPATSEIEELAPYVGRFSERAAQIGRNLDRYEAQWRAANPGQEPGPVLRQSWDRRAWKDARPDKVVPTNGADLVGRWTEELYCVGYRDPNPRLPLATGPRVGGLDRDDAVETVLTRLGARRSAWNAADVRGEVEKWIATTGLVAEAAVRLELAEDLTARTLDACTPLLDRHGVPEHIRALTSAQVVAVEADLVTRLAHRADQAANPADLDGREIGTLDVAQREAVAALAGTGALLVVEGAAGAGKTTALAAASTLVAAQGHRMVVLTPTLKASRVASRQLRATSGEGAGSEASAFSAAWLIHQHGFRWDEDGYWTRIEADPQPQAALAPGDLLLIDEAGMLDQDTARAVLTIADETGARVALVGDRHQLPAVGRGGVLDLAARWASPDAQVCLDVVHRFTDPDYAVISLAMRTGTSLATARRNVQAREPVGTPRGERGGERGGERVGPAAVDCYRPVTSGEAGSGRSGEPRGEVFDALWARDQIRVYASQTERTAALADLAATAVLSCDPTLGPTAEAVVVMADTREQVAGLNGAIRDRLVQAGRVDDNHVVVTRSGQRLGVGDRVATRRNDRDLKVANRDTWTITGIGEDGALSVEGTGRAGARTLPTEYVRDQVELAYATTVYGAQGETTRVGHLLLGEHTTGAGAYVGMTRGREDNVAHLVAEDADQARALWDATFGRDRADLGPAHAAQRAAEDVDRYAPHRPLAAALADLRSAWTAEEDARSAIHRAAQRRDTVAAYGPPAAGRVAEINAEINAEIADYTALFDAATEHVRARLREPAIRTLPQARIDAEHANWLQERRATQQARREAWQRQQAQLTPRRPEFDLGYRRPDPGRGIGF
jgi:conjugative relaxase-like TrwC/TraI family protein